MICCRFERSYVESVVWEVNSELWHPNSSVRGVWLGSRGESQDRHGG